MKTKQFEMEATEAQARDLAEYQKTQAVVVEKLNKDANKKLSGMNEKTKTLTSKVKDLNEQRLSERTEAVLELKANVDAVRAEVATQAEKHVRKLEKARKQLEDEKESMLSQGLNPYVEFRRKEFEEEAARREQKLKDAVEQNKKNLAIQMEKEHQFTEKQDKTKRDAEKYAKVHRESLGRHVIEERNSKYIESKTSAHTEVLDPSGKLSRVDPSQITDIADFSFGLGKSSRIPKDKMRSITEKIREELRVEKGDLGEYRRLIGGLEKSVSLEDADEMDGRRMGADDESSVGQPTATTKKPSTAPSMQDQTQKNVGLNQSHQFGDRELYNLEVLGSNNGAIPGMDKATTDINFQNDEITKAELLRIAVADEGDIVDENKKIESIPTPKYPAVKLSKFEQDSLERAKERHRDRIEQGTIQIAGGKVFKGEAFAATPSTLLYKDFEVGKLYKKVLVLTNVSYTFNSFKLLDLDDEYVDFFTITFDRPGRMSAGMSCSLEIVFKPQLNQDIFTFLRLLTETGPVNIPLQCLIRRCAPRILDTELDFEEMVIGQRQTLPVKIVNSQALATSFTIEEVPHEDDNKDFNIKVLTNDPTETMDPSLYNNNNKNNEESSELKIETGAMLDETVRQLPGAVGFRDSATNEFELWTRIKRILTKILREKKQQQAKPFVCYISSSFEDPSSPTKQQQSSDNTINNNNSNEDNSDIHIRKEILVKEGLVPGYDAVQLTVRAAPLLLGILEREFVVKFHQVDESMKSVDEKGILVTKEQFIRVKVECEELPIYIEDNIIDLKCCLYNRIYRKKLLIHNRGKIAYRLTIKVPQKFSKFIEVGPSVFFVQSKSSQYINIKFTPTVEILEKLAYFTLPNETFPDAALVTLPIEIQVINQDLPVYFVLKSLITPSTIEISPEGSALSFGKVFLGQKTIRKIKLRNISMLPQKIAFVRMKKEVTIQPNDGFAVLLPLEESEFEISFAPLSAIEYKFDLTLMTSWNDTYTIPLHAFGVEPPIVLSNTVIQMRTTAPGQHVVESIFLTNQSSSIQCFEIMLPEKKFTWLNISPTCLDLTPGQTARIEIDYCPPSNVTTLVPLQWHTHLLDELKLHNPDIQTPFQEWIDDQPWMLGKGLYGNVMWSVVSDGKKENPIKEAGENNGEEGNAETKTLEDEMNSPKETLKNNNNNAEDQEGGGEGHLPPTFVTGKSLPKQDFGIFGKWDIPILIKSKKKPAASTGSSNPQTNEPASSTSVLGSTILNSATGVNTSFAANQSLGNKPIPLMISVETTVILPQMEADQTYINFGQMAIGTRQLKSFKIFNHSYTETLELQTVGLNAMGPFVLIRPIKSIKPQSSKVVIVECLPKLPGLNTEVIEIFTKNNESKGGHQLQITCSVQGLMPIISLEGLLPPPSSALLSLLSNAQKNLDAQLSSSSLAADDLLPPKTSAITIWNNRSGILDFGNVTISELPIIKKFTIKNQSSFKINTVIKRFNSNNITNISEARELIERTVVGLPIISIRPEIVSIEPNKSEEIEVIFRPDHYRVLPYREDFQILVGETDEILHVGVMGRTFIRQYNILPASVLDELYYYHNYNNNLNNTQLQNECYQILEKNILKQTLFNLNIEENLQFYYQDNVRKLVSDSKDQFQLLPVKLSFPYFILKFNNPYDANVSPDSYLIVDNPQGAVGGAAGGAGKGAKGATSANLNPGGTMGTTYRKQSKKFKLFSAKSGNSSRELTNPGNYEVQLSQAAKDCGFFTVVGEKGTITPAKEEMIEIACTQPKPRALGGVPVGSWKTYDATVVIKGGYFPIDEADENKIPIKLMAFVSI
jgi:hypothetical protein